MLKKKNIAMMMAVATAATTAAPAFADVTSQEDVIRTEGMKAFVDEVEAKFNMKYADVAENGDKRDTHVYTITFAGKTIVDKVKTEADEATLDQFKAAVNGMKNGEIIDVTITDGGHEERNGKIYANAVPEYVAENGAISEIEKLEADVVTDYTLSKDKKVISDKEVEYTLSFKNDTTKEVEYTVTLGNGDKKLNFAIPVKDKANKLVGFEKFAYDEITPEDEVKKRLSKSAEKTMQVSELFDGADLTEAGQALAGITFEANNYATDADTNNKDRVTKEQMNAIGFNVDTIINTVKANEEYEVKLFVKNIKLNRDNASDSLTQAGDLAEITIKSSSKAVLTAFIDELKTYTPGESAELIAGADRYETAIEISKHKYTADYLKDNTVDSIVLVGQNAIVDGLAAGPLATSKNAPILYSGKDAINEKTMEEITRLFGTVAGKTVYIVSGESHISKEVEKQLSSKGINVKRIAGTDRVDTSLKIAEEIGNAAHTKAFVVGYKGEADAMSIASVASKKLADDKVTPIIVSGTNGLTEDAKDYLVNKDDVTLVGGTTTLTSNVEEELKALKVSTVERIAGEDRQDTNAKVIDEFYASHKGDVYVSKAYALVDALAAAPSIDGAPMVLVGNSLTKSQENVLEDIAQTQDKKVYQVGNGIAKTIMNKVMNLVK